MKPDWEKGLRGRVYAWGRSALPLAWRRAIRRRLAPERLLGIRKPAVETPTYRFDPMESRPGRPDVLLLPVIAWSYRRQRPQQLAEALARRGKRVFYGALRGPGEPDAPTGVAPGVTLLPIAGPRREDPGDRRLEGRSLEAAFDSLAAARDEFELHECAVLIESPFWTPLAKRLRERFGWKVVYDCLDEHGGFATNRAGLVEQAEEDLVRTADLVLATSPVLLERLSSTANEPKLLPNACDFELFAAGVRPEAASEEALTVGYVGAIDEWFDASLFDELARRRPAWRFEIVGGGEGTGASRPAPAGNVVFHGEKPHRELPPLRARFDVEIIPFRLTPLTHAVDPVKLYEAAAAGRPVVATPMRSLLPLSDRGLLRLAGTAEEFVRQIEEAARRSPAEADRLRAFARESTWDARAAQLDAWTTALYPLVSLVVVSWNGLEWNRMCLESLDRRTDWPNLELIWVDNGSTDGTSAWLGEQAQRRDPERFRVIPFDSNRGFAPAVNSGLAGARGEYLGLLNNDTIVTRGWLSALVRHLQSDAALGMVGASTNEIANAARVDVGYRDAAELERWARRFTAARRGVAEPIEMLAMFCVLMPRGAWEKVGPLDERFETGMFEDDDYARRVAAAGLHLAVARDSFVHHRGRGSFRALGEAEYLRIHAENRARFEQKWKEPPRSGAPVSTPEGIAAAARSAGSLFVFPPSIGWDITLIQRPHHLARALARRGYPVVFEEEPSPNARALREVEPRLFVAPGGLPEVSGARPMYWAFAYNVPDESRLAGARLIYDVIDHPDVFPHSRALMRRNHDRALATADVVLAVSRPLLEQVREQRPDAVYLPNGVDFERFSAVPDPALVPEVLERARDPGRPGAIFLGALARWVDADLLVSVARLRPDWDFLLVGEPLDDTFDRALGRGKPGNLVFTGAVPHASVPSVLAAFDTGLIPFRAGSEGANASPVKLYEYLAAGLPVIATPIAEARSVPEVLTAEGPDGFVALLDRARADRRSEDFRRRARERARQNDWSARIETALGAIKLPASVG